MNIRVKLFATLTRYAPGHFAGAPFGLELPNGARLADVSRLLQLPAEEVKVCFVNGRVQDLNFELHSGDEVGIFPPVGGG